MSILPNVSGILSFMYTDRMTVQRYADGTGPDGEDAKVLDPVPVLNDISCRISFNGKDSPSMSQDGNPSDIRPTLICRPDVPLKNGDFVTVRRNGTELYSGNIGRPNPFGSSLQVLFQDKGTA